MTVPAFGLDGFCPALRWRPAGADPGGNNGRAFEPFAAPPEFTIVETQQT